MPTAIGIRFKDSGKTYHFDPGDVPLERGDWAIVETARGPELGRVASDVADISDDQVIGDLKPVLRRATQTDLDHLLHLQQYEPEALQMCSAKVAEHRLPMHLVKAEYNFDGSRLTFYFTAEKRVDFRALVRDLARSFRTRIELRQIGPRDEAKLLGGIGPCGRLLCCSTFLPDFARVSIKMAKDQDLPLNPSKISGVCGRLLCCLSYEHEQYLEIKAELPQRGDWVQTRDGPGEVVAVNVVKECVTVELYNGNTVDCTAQQILEVRQRVAAEAQSRNSEGITPVVNDRGGPQPIIAGEEGLLPDDTDLRALAEPDDSPPTVARSESPRRVAERPDAVLGEAVSQRKREDRRPRTENRERQPSAEGSRPTRWKPQAHAEPHKHTSVGDGRRQGGRSGDAPQQKPPAGDPPHGGSGAAGARRRKRSRGRGGKN